MNLLLKVRRILIQRYKICILSKNSLFTRLILSGLHFPDRIQMTDSTFEVNNKRLKF